jgi:hypothetical protein
MRWKTERTREFEEWWETLTVAERKRIASSLRILEESGPNTGRPFVDSIKGSVHPNMKELRATHSIRVFFAFDPRRVAILLIGGDKAGKTRRFYRQMVARADKIYDAHLRRITKGMAEDGQRRN